MSSRTSVKGVESCLLGSFFKIPLIGSKMSELLISGQNARLIESYMGRG